MLDKGSAIAPVCRSQGRRVAVACAEEDGVQYGGMLSSHTSKLKEAMLTTRDQKMCALPLPPPSICPNFRTPAQK